MFSISMTPLSQEDEKMLLMHILPPQNSLSSFAEKNISICLSFKVRFVPIKYYQLSITTAKYYLMYALNKG